MLQLRDALAKRLMFPQALQLEKQDPDKDGDHCIGLKTFITICLVLEVLPEEGFEQQSSIYVEEGDQNGYNERRSGNNITPYLLVEQHSPTWGEDIQKQKTIVSKYLRS